MTELLPTDHAWKRRGDGVQWTSFRTYVNKLKINGLTADEIIESRPWSFQPGKMKKLWWASRKNELKSNELVKIQIWPWRFEAYQKYRAALWFKLCPFLWVNKLFARQQSRTFMQQVFMYLVNQFMLIKKYLFEKITKNYQGKFLN